jgi:transcriptional regulator with XRE-family HTH domain
MKWFEKLAFARKVLKLSLRDVAKQTGVSNPYICQLETGKIKEPSFFKMIKLMDFYNMNTEDLQEIVDSINEEDENQFDDKMVTCSACGTKHIRGSMCHKCFGYGNSVK